VLDEAGGSCIPLRCSGMGAGQGDPAATLLLLCWDRWTTANTHAPGATKRLLPQTRAAAV
jgi:hypothetical protein